MIDKRNDHQSVSIYLKNEILYMWPMCKTSLSPGLRVFNGGFVSLPFNTSPSDIVDSIKKALESSSTIVEGNDFRSPRMDNSILLQKSGCKSLKSFYEKIKSVSVLYFPMESAFLFEPQRQFSKGSFELIEGKSLNLNGNADDVNIVMVLKKALSISE